MTDRLRPLLAATALIFLAWHVRALPRTLEDIDSINFALGVESFDLHKHQPHPPGYPVFIAMSKVSTAAVAIARPGWDRDRRAAAGLALWNVIAGALAVSVFFQFWTAVGLSPVAAFLAAVVAVTCPLFWFTASRPLTDTVGLVAAVGIQTLFIRAIREPLNEARGLRREWILGALGAGLIVGVRSQTMWQTLPFLLWGFVLLLKRKAGGPAAWLVACGAVGSLVWAIPLVIDSGGLDAYLRELRGQGGEDFAGVEMLATTPSKELFELAMHRTFVAPWIEKTFAHIVLGLALIGLGRLLVRNRRAVAIVIAGFLPYLLFHLAFQETETVRYSLPVIVPVTGFAVAALTWLGVRAGVTLALAVSLASIVFVHPRLGAYAADGAPVFRAFQDMQQARASQAEPPVLQMHHQVWWGVRRVLDWYRSVWEAGPQPFPGDREWLSIVDHWNRGETRPIWFLADPKRSDIALFDRRGRTLGGRYALDEDIRDLVGGARLDSLDWWQLTRPMWMLGTGWSLTPEVGGVTAFDAVRAPGAPAVGYVRRTTRPLRMLVGTRYLGGTGPAEVIATLDGIELARWEVVGSPNWFVRWIDLPAGVPNGPGPYAKLVVAPPTGTGAPRIGFEQFDVAGVDETMFAFGGGWHELEENPETGRLWRWSSGRSTVVIRGSGRNLTMEIAGESPRKYFYVPSSIVIRADTRELTRFSTADDYSRTVDLPAEALAASGGVVTIETDQTFVPAERGSSPDRRRLGLRLWRAEITER